MSGDPIDGETVPTQKMAERLSKILGCEGSHKVGDEWGPCPSREHLDYLIRNGSRKYREWAEDKENETKSLTRSDSFKPTSGMISEAKRSLEWRSEFGRGGTAVGIARARDISNGKSLSYDTVKRMKAFFDRHQGNKKAEGFRPGEKGYPSNGRISWAMWGGDAGYSWSRSIVSRVESSEKSYDTKSDPKTPAKPSERISGSSTNKPGSASSSRGKITLNESTVASLKKKVKEHNKKMAKQGKGSGSRASLGALKAVWRRGAGAFSTSHRPGVGRQQWAMARVNAFLHLLSTGSPKNSKYTTDNDLLPAGHKRSSKKKSFENVQEADFFTCFVKVDGVMRDVKSVRGSTVRYTRKEDALSHAALLGISGVHKVGGYWAPGKNEEEFLEALETNGQLMRRRPVRSRNGELNTYGFSGVGISNSAGGGFVSGVS